MLWACKLYKDRPYQELAMFFSGGGGEINLNDFSATKSRYRSVVILVTMVAFITVITHTADCYSAVHVTSASTAPCTM